MAFDCAPSVGQAVEELAVNNGRQDAIVLPVGAARFLTRPRPVKHSACAPKVPAGKLVGALACGTFFEWQASVKC